MMQEIGNNVPAKGNVWMKVLGVVLVIAAIGYIVMPYDFDHRGILGFVDDFFIFMAAFVFCNATFQKPERKFIRRQLFMIATVFFILGMVWVSVISLLPQ